MDALLVERITEAEREAFADMKTDLESGARRALSRKQLEWAKQVRERFAPTYENAWSEGRVPKGRDVETPAALKFLPKSPPRRCRLCGRIGCAADCL